MLQEEEGRKKGEEGQGKNIFFSPALHPTHVEGTDSGNWQERVDQKNSQWHGRKHQIFSGK